MAGEGIGTGNPFSSAGHRWTWGDQDQASKVLRATGVDGAGRMVLGNHARPGTIRGILKASGSTRALADAALDALVAVIEALRRAGTASTWEDDQAHTGSLLVVTGLRLSPREYGSEGGQAVVMADYECAVLELDGKP
jgi:hypothetical protein